MLKAGTLLTLMDMGFGVCNGLPNIKLSLEIMRSFSSKTGGEYVMSDAVEKALLPGINIMAQHLVALEERETAQEMWLTWLTAVGGVTMGGAFMFLLMRRMVMKRTPQAGVALESVKVG